MRLFAIALISTLSAVASALHGFSTEPNKIPPSWFPFVSDDDYTLNRENTVFHAFRTDAFGPNGGLVRCVELFNSDDDQLVYATTDEVIRDFQRSDYVETGVDFFIFQFQREDTVPLLRTRIRGGQYLFTTSFEEANDNRFIIRGIVGYVYPESTNGAVPITRWLLRRD